jgi:hypothetical protein
MVFLPLGRSDNVVAPDQIVVKGGGKGRKMIDRSFIRYQGRRFALGIIVLAKGWNCDATKHATK